MTDTASLLTELEAEDDFVRRHIGPGEEQTEHMLQQLGCTSLDDLIDKTVPKSILSDQPLDIPESLSERMMLSELRDIRERNKVFTSMIGMGYHGTVTPPVILRNVLSNPGWYTAYTPYQPEVSQGRLEVLLNFQQMIVDLTGMEMANASLLDEATAAAEAIAMARRISKKETDTAFVDSECHPQTIAVLETRAWSMGFDLVFGDPETDLAGTDCFAALIQYPGTNGAVRDLDPIVKAAHDQEALAIVAADLLSLALLKPPGEMDADVVVGSAQRFGVPMGYGGPHAAYFATREKYKRSVPGRIIGVSVDSLGRTAMRMALQTREQHIRREKAMSNICTSQVLLAVVAALYGVYHGPDGVKRISTRVHHMTKIVAAGLQKLGFELVNDTFFDTITVKTPSVAARVVAKAREYSINLRFVDGDHVGISLDETTKRADINHLWLAFSAKAQGICDILDLDREVKECIPKDLQRTSPFMEHDIFKRYHGETEMMRYLRRLAAKDIALDRSMIPLGSCTMKLNAASEMIPITWRNFSHMHPFAPLDQTQGYQQLFEELEEWLSEITGYDAISLQPNAGSQGEYTGLLVIRKYHETRGEGHRDICLIPSSAHGTNPASAVMAGMRVVVVACDDHGNIDLDDLKAKAEEHSDNLSACMITYPSTHGVFEESVEAVCDLIHKHGGQVYVDGANLNAMVGLCKPGKFGADVSHLNLHKTFCIPHGGGGPGMGPIGVRRHLAPFLPGHPLVEGVNPVGHEGEPIGPVAAAPYGSASILPITWAYIRMMGPAGLKKATQIAILNANYIAHRLKDHYPILYTGRGGFVAHECIIDCRAFKEESGVTVEDIAKRLVDYGYHSPTMSWPVAETLMIEPTESEAKRELDKFCDALIQIRREIQEVADGKADAKDNLLKNAPHTQHLLLDKDWNKPYSKEQAFFPLSVLQGDKYWPPVGRVDNVAGDRNLVCTCPPMEAYAEAAE